MASAASPQPLLAACGLYCGACYHYRASFPEGSYLLERAAAEGRSLDHFSCQGCRSNRLYIHPGCSQCAIRACALRRGLLHCGQCAHLPCQQLLAFQNDGRSHHLPILENLQVLNAQGAETWLAAQCARWTCPCGLALSWYDAVCPRCGRPASHG